MFITAGLGLLNRGWLMSEDDKDHYARTGRLPRRRFRFKRGLSGIVLLAVAISLLWVTFLVQSYLGLTSEIKVAQIRATPITKYLLQGDEWMLQGDIIKFPAWLNVVGLHSGYKLTRLEGRYDDINLERTAPHSAIELNGGDDNFFKTAYTQKSWFGAFVDAYGNAVIQTAGSFNVFATQDALIASPTG